MKFLGYVIFLNKRRVYNLYHNISNAKIEIDLKFLDDSSLKQIVKEIIFKAIVEQN